MKKIIFAALFIASISFQDSLAPANPKPPQGIQYLVGGILGHFTLSKLARDVMSKDATLKSYASSAVFTITGLCLYSWLPSELKHLKTAFAWTALTGIGHAVRDKLSEKEKEQTSETGRNGSY